MTKTQSDELGDLRLPELWARYEKAVGETTRCPNRTFLIRRIAEGQAARRSKKEPGDNPAPAAASRRTRSKRTVKADTAASPRGRFTAMTVEQLTAAYEHTVGRATNSTNRAYLIWKIREAEKGRVPIGPRATRTPGQEAQTDMRILPLRLHVDAANALDQAWRNAGMKSRMELLRKALQRQMRHLGLSDAAALFA